MKTKIPKANNKLQDQIALLILHSSIQLESMEESARQADESCKIFEEIAQNDAPIPDEIRLHLANIFKAWFQFRRIRNDKACGDSLKEMCGSLEVLKKHVNYRKKISQALKETNLKAA